VERVKAKAAAAILLTLVISMFAVQVGANGNNNPNKIHGSPAYVLNILGKKSDWKAQGDFNNPDRHAIFVPANTTEWGGTAGNYGNLTTENTVLIWMTSGPEFAVLDGNALDDGNASLQIENGRYYVYVVALAKPGGDSDLKGWYYDNEGNACYRLGEVKKIKRERGQPVWVNGTDLFYIEWSQLLALGFSEEELVLYFGEEQVGEPVWIFDFLQFLEDAYSDTDYYFWQLDNKGNKHIQVRFYKS